MGTDEQPIKKRAPTLYAIIALKLLKGLLFVTLAVVAYTLSDKDLPAELRQVLESSRLDPERKFWAELAIQLGHLTEAKVRWAAAGTLVYSMFSFVEGIGLMFRISWAGWMAIGESAFFIPIEIWELVRRTARDRAGTGHPATVAVVLVINILIVWYLVQNRQRLFRHHLH